MGLPQRLGNPVAAKTAGYERVRGGDVRNVPRGDVERFYAVSRAKDDTDLLCTQEQRPGEPFLKGQRFMVAA